MNLTACRTLVPYTYNLESLHQNDRLSDLPDEILLNIFENFSENNAENGKTLQSLILTSRRFRAFIWTQCPKIVFTFYRFLSASKNNSIPTLEQFQRIELRTNSDYPIDAALLEASAADAVDAIRWAVFQKRNVSESGPLISLMFEIALKRNALNALEYLGNRFEGGVPNHHEKTFLIACLKHNINLVNKLASKIDPNLVVSKRDFLGEQTYTNLTYYGFGNLEADDVIIAAFKLAILSRDITVIKKIYSLISREQTHSAHFQRMFWDAASGSTANVVCVETIIACGYRPLEKLENLYAHAAFKLHVLLTAVSSEMVFSSIPNWSHTATDMLNRIIGNTPSSISESLRDCNQIHKTAYLFKLNFRHGTYTEAALNNNFSYNLYERVRVIQIKVYCTLIEIVERIATLFEQVLKGMINIARSPFTGMKDLKLGARQLFLEPLGQVCAIATIPLVLLALCEQLLIACLSPIRYFEKNISNEPSSIDKAHLEAITKEFCNSSAEDKIKIFMNDVNLYCVFLCFYLGIQGHRL